MSTQDEFGRSNSGEDEELDFLEKVKKRVLRDATNAKQYLTDYHGWCLDMHRFYFNANQYVNLRKKNKFPSTLIQENIDLFVADTRDKLFYAKRPCTLVGREEQDKADADAKQAFLDYQDVEDDIYGKIGKALHNASLYRFAPAKVDYEKRTRREWVAKDVPEVAKTPDGMPMLNEQGEEIPLIDPATGQMIPSGQKEWVLEDVVYYQGATVKVIDPMNLFFTRDKDRIDDEFAVMIRDFQALDYFYSQPYFFNQDQIKNRAGFPTSENDPATKRTDQGLSVDSYNTERGNEYFEWQGLLDKAELYEFLGASEEEMASIPPGEKAWAIVGLVNGETVVQLRENPFKLDRPNIVVGQVMADEEGLMGVAISQKIEAMQRGDEDTKGMYLENLKQAINAFWIINKTKIVGASPIVNKAGGILETNGNPSEVAQRVEQPPVSKDIYAWFDMMRQQAQDASGRSDIATGRGDPAAETLGESNMAFSQASLRMRDYLRTFENTFVIPLYQLRNHINACFIDEPYRFRVLGDKAQDWREITPGQMRASVDFICESSTRETQRAVIVQQMLQFIDVAQVALSQGQPVRVDKMMAELASSGFNWSQDKIKEYFPLLALEDSGEVDINQMLVQGALLSMQGNNLAAMMGPAGQPGGGGGGNMPRPTSESAAIQSANQRNQPNPKAVQR